MARRKSAYRGFHWETDTLTPNIKKLPLKLERAIVAAIEYHATRAEAYARSNAPWTDRTTNARNGLFAVTEHEPFKAHRIILSHSVPYGIWLEIRWSGKYQIILPTIDRTGRDVMDTIGKFLATSIKM